MSLYMSRARVDTRVRTWTEDRAMTMTAPRAKRIPLVLPPADYEALVALAEHEQRTASQQAAYIVRRSLAGLQGQAMDEAGEEPAGAAAAPR
jgi:hypothetical protein